MQKMRGFTLRLIFVRLVVRNRDVLGCLRIVSSSFGAVGVEPSGSSTTVLVEDHGFRRAAMVPGCCMTM
jgi:hypothetical protein